jgi:hypothetical protein
MNGTEHKIPPEDIPFYRSTPAGEKIENARTY